MYETPDYAMQNDFIWVKMLYAFSKSAGFFLRKKFFKFMISSHTPKTLKDFKISQQSSRGAKSCSCKEAV